MKQAPPRQVLIIALVVGVLGMAWVWLSEGMSYPAKMPVLQERAQHYLWHDQVRATTFWVGEAADQSNNYIHNSASAWTLDWVGAYGGVDSPTKRCGGLPCDVAPKENPYYIALPYNDLTNECQAKNSQKLVPWYAGPLPPGQSLIKNRWAEIRFNDKAAYAQWEDAGPSGEDDTAYVFGDARPSAQFGIDLSPATTAYLGTDGDDPVNWRFVADAVVPDGPWKKTITTSPPDCARH